MKTVADFKRKMILGAKVNSSLYWVDRATNELKQVNELKDREVTIVQSNSFALSMEKGGKQVNSWCDWPKRDQFKVIDENTAECIFEGGKLVYQFI